MTTKNFSSENKYRHQYWIAGYKYCARWFVSLLVCCCAGGLQAQTPIWTQHAYGIGSSNAQTGCGYSSKSQAVDFAGNLYVTGCEVAPNHTITSWVTYKVDGTTGTTLWRAVFPAGNTVANGVALALDTAGNVAVTGFSIESTGQKIRTIRYDGTTGTELWNVVRASAAGSVDIGNAIATDSSGNVFVAGRTADGGGSGDNMRIIKYGRTTGAELWTQAISGNVVNSADAANAIVIDAHDDVIITGTTEDSIGSNNMRTIKYAGTNGSELWNVSLSGSTLNGFDSGAAIAVDAANNVFVTGVSTETTGGANIRTVKYDAATGGMLWTRFYSGTALGFDFGRALVVDSTGNVIITGYSTDIGTIDNMRTIKYAGNNGNELWSVAFNGSVSGVDSGYAIAIDASDNLIVTGYTNDVGEGANIRTIKYNGTNGATLWNLSATGKAIGLDVGFAVNVDTSGNVLVSGRSAEPVVGSQIRTVKYNGASGSVMWNTLQSALGAATIAPGTLAYKPLKFDTNGDVIATGRSVEGASGFNMRTAKFNGTTGAPIWNVTYNGTEQSAAVAADAGNAVAVDASGDVFVTGISSETGILTNMRTIKYSGANGAELWNIVYANASNLAGRGNAIAVDTSGNVFVAGGTTELFGQENMRTIKYNGANGSVLWNAVFTGTSAGPNAANAIIVDGIGNVIITGQSNDSVNNNMHTIKYNGATGAVLWSANFVGSGQSAAGYAIATDASNNVFVTGSSSDTAGGTNFRTIKYNSTTGAAMWNASYNGSANGFDASLAIAIDAGGNAIVTGRSTDAPGNINIRTIKYNGTNGTEMWNTAFTGGSAGGLAVAVDTSGHVIVTGYSPDGISSQNLRTVKYDGATGAAMWNTAYGASGSNVNGTNAAYAVAIAPDNNIVILGKSTEAGKPEGWLVQKLTNTIPAPILAMVQSRKTHGPAGPFDLLVDHHQPLHGSVTVEPRAIGVGHVVVFQFDTPVVATATAVSDTGATINVASTVSSGNEVRVTLAGVADNSRVMVTLTGVGSAVNETASLGFLLGDVNSTRSVNPIDVSGVKARSGQIVDAANFRFDLNASGMINAADIATMKARSGLQLQP